MRNGEQWRVVCLLSRLQSNFKPFVFFLIFVLVFFLGGRGGGGVGFASTLVRAAMASDDEIFLSQNTFSQEPFSLS